MNITPPFGYREVVPFLKDQKVRMPETSTILEFVGQRHFMPLSYSEMHLAQHNYPVVFAPVGDGKSYTVLGVLGIVDGENLFVGPQGWTPGVYVPAYVRRYPFCMTRVRVDGVEQDQRVICVEKAFLDNEAGMACFDAAGNPVPRWTEILNFLNEFEVDLARTAELCSIVADFKLLEPFTMRATVGEKQFTLEGMFKVNENQLDVLNANELKTLIKKRMIGPIYHHLASLTRFNHLIEMKEARIKAAGSAGAA